MSATDESEPTWRLFDADAHCGDLVGELRRWGAIKVGTDFVQPNGWGPPLTRLLNDAATVLDRVNDIVIRTGGDADRSEFHRGWSRCCAMVGAAFRLPKPEKLKMTEPNSSREAVEQHRATQGRSELPFKVGDIVVLRSGGPKMTIARVREDGNVDTDWFEDGSGSLQRDVFHEAQLKHAPPKETP